MSNLAKMMMLVFFVVIAIQYGLFFWGASRPDFGHMVKTSEGLIAFWNGAGKITEAAVDKNEDGKYEKWLSTAWEKSSPTIENTLFDNNNDGVFDSSLYCISKMQTTIPKAELNIVRKSDKNGSMSDFMLLSLINNNGNAKVKYFDLDFDGFWDFMERHADNSDEPMKFLWWQDRWQAVTGADGSKPDHVGQWILVDGKKVPMKWENGAWNEAK